MLFDREVVEQHRLVAIQLENGWSLAGAVFSSNMDLSSMGSRSCDKGWICEMQKLFGKKFIIG
jgi:hypothetical protein